MKNETSSIFGPPGTGKSTEVIRRFKALLEKGIPAERIGLVSFTKAAAKELAHRIGVDSPNIATIHSYCYRLLNISQQQVVGWSHLKEFEKIVGIEIRGDNPDDNEELCEGDHYLTIYGLAHARMKTYEETYASVIDKVGSREKFIYFAKTYDNWKNNFGYIDFSDMLGNALDVDAPDLDFLFVDEAQDLSPLQWAVIRHWSGTIRNITIAGDDDQAIYVWGGADPDGMHKFEREYQSKRTILGQSYRVPQIAHRLAEQVITRVFSRVEKTYMPRDEVGELKYHSTPYSVDIKHGTDMLVLYRSHYMRSEIEEILINKGIPYIVDSGKQGVLQSPLARCIRMFKKLRDRLTETPEIKEGSISQAAAALYKRHLSPITLAAIERGDVDKILTGPWERHMKTRGPWLTYLKKVEQQYGLDVEPTIHLSTIHGSKGRQADTVVLLNQTSASIQATMDKTDGYDAEMRTMYVGITRTMRRLDIINGENALPELTLRGEK